MTPITIMGLWKYYLLLLVTILSKPQLQDQRMYTDGIWQSCSLCMCSMHCDSQAKLANPLTNNLSFDNSNAALKNNAQSKYRQIFIAHKFHSGLSSTSLY